MGYLLKRGNTIYNDFEENGKKNYKQKNYVQASYIKYLKKHLKSEMNSNLLIA